MIPIPDYIRSYSTLKEMLRCACMRYPKPEKNICYVTIIFWRKTDSLIFTLLKKLILSFNRRHRGNGTNKTTIYYFSYQQFMAQIKLIHDTNYNVIHILYSLFRWRFPFSYSLLFRHSDHHRRKSSRTSPPAEMSKGCWEKNNQSGKHHNSIPLLKRTSRTIREGKRWGSRLFRTRQKDRTCNRYTGNTSPQKKGITTAYINC